MTKPIEVAIVAWGDDWELLYINGELKRSEHSIRNDDLLQALIEAGANIDFRDTPTWEDDDCPWDLDGFYPDPPDMLVDCLDRMYFEMLRDEEDTEEE